MAPGLLVPAVLLLAAVVLLLGVVVGAYLGPPPATPGPRPTPSPVGFAQPPVEAERATMLGLVVAVRDGTSATVLVAGQTLEVTLLGVDNPDQVGSGVPLECTAEPARQLATTTLIGQTVTLVPDPTIPEIDQAGRRRAYLVLRTQQNYTDLALSRGVARHNTEIPLWYDDVFAAEEATARASRTGIWADTCTPSR